MGILLFALLMIALAIAIRARGGTHVPDRLEGVYLLMAPLPALLSVGAPAMIGWASGFDEASTRWIRGFSWAGVGLSVLLLLAGAALVIRSASRGRRWTWPLGGAVLLAAMPLGILLLGYAVLALVGVLHARRSRGS